jgi:hypothetical protein
MCNRSLCEACKSSEETLEMLQNVCGNRDTAKLQCFNDGSILKTQTKGLLMRLKVEAQALLSLI